VFSSLNHFVFQLSCMHLSQSHQQLFVMFTGGSRLPNWGNPPLPSLPYLPLLLLFSSTLLLLRPLRSRPLKTAMGSGGNRSWCILALKSDIWWHQFYYPRDALLSRSLRQRRVCPSVCHTPVLCLAERKQDREMYSV